MLPLYLLHLLHLLACRDPGISADSGEGPDTAAPGETGQAGETGRDGETGETGETDETAETGDSGTEGCRAIEGDVLPTAVRTVDGWTGSPLGLYNGLNTIWATEVETAAEARDWVVEERLPVMAALGMGTSRIHDADGYFSFAWPEVDRDRDGAAFDYEGADTVVRLACEHGVSLLPTISPGTLETMVRGQPFLPDVDLYAAFVGDIVERYDGDDDFGAWAIDADTAVAVRACPVTHWMVGNELDVAAVRDPSWIDSESYASALTAAHTAAHAADEGARTLYGGLAIVSAWDSPQWGFFRGVLAAGGAFDEMAVHVYPSQTDFMAWQIELLDGIRAELGPEVPIWITEAGIMAMNTPENLLEDDDATERTQARDLLVLAMVQWARSPRPLLWIDVDWLGELSPPLEGAGLYDRATGCPRLSWYAWRSLARHIDEADWTAVEALRETPPYAWSMPLDDGGALWLLAGEGSVAVPADGDMVTVTPVYEDVDSGALVATEDLDSEAVAVVDGVATVEVGEVPLWVRAE